MRQDDIDESAPHSLEEKLAIRDTPRDDVARRTRKSILTARFSKVVGWRGSRRVLLLDTGISRSFWMCSSDSGQELASAMYERIIPTVREHFMWHPETAPYFAPDEESQPRRKP